MEPDDEVSVEDPGGGSTGSPRRTEREAVLGFRADFVHLEGNLLHGLLDPCALTLAALGGHADQPSGFERDVQ